MAVGPFTPFTPNPLTTPIPDNQTSKKRKGAPDESELTSTDKKLKNVAINTWVKSGTPKGKEQVFPMSAPKESEAVQIATPLSQHRKANTFGKTGKTSARSKDQVVHKTEVFTTVKAKILATHKNNMQKLSKLKEAIILRHKRIASMFTKFIFRKRLEVIGKNLDRDINNTSKETAFRDESSKGFKELTKEMNAEFSKMKIPIPLLSSTGEDLTKETRKLPATDLLKSFVIEFEKSEKSGDTLQLKQLLQLLSEKYEKISGVEKGTGPVFAVMTFFLRVVCPLVGDSFSGKLDLKSPDMKNAQYAAYVSAGLQDIANSYTSKKGISDEQLDLMERFKKLFFLKY